MSTDQEKNQEKTEGLKESLNHLMVEGDLAPGEALRTIALHCLTLSEWAPTIAESKKHLYAAKYIQQAIRELESLPNE